MQLANELHRRGGAGMNRMFRGGCQMLALLLVCWSGYAGADDTAEPKAIVENLHEALLVAMKQASTLGFQGRYKLLEPTLNKAFDFPTIARIVTGRHWKSLSAEKQQVFLEVFTKLSIATYANNFDAYSGEHFETRAVEPKRDAVLVKTALIKSDGKAVELNYLLQKQKDRWQIVNVIAEGVSDLSLKRADYSAVIGSDGIDSLIGKLNGKIATYESGTKSP